MAPAAVFLPGREERISDGRLFRGITMLWVSIDNLGPDATFTAQIRGIEPVKQLETGRLLGPRNADDVAWESTTEAEQMIRRGKRARLRLGAASRDPFCFWILGPKNETWAPTGYQWGWRLVPVTDQVIFKLYVLHIESGHAEVRDCALDFNLEDYSVASFRFAE